MNFLSKRIFSHLSVRYIFNRMSVMANQFRYKDNPWLTSCAVRMLDSMLTSSDIGVEFDSCRSKLWFTQRLKQFISIEKNPEWYVKVKKNLSISSLEKEVKLIEL